MAPPPAGVLLVAAISVLAWSPSSAFRLLPSGDATPFAKACTVPFTPKTVDVGGYLGWALGINTSWVQPNIYVGDKLRFTWLEPPKGGGSSKLLEHDLWQLKSQANFDKCSFKGAKELAEHKNYTTKALSKAGVYLYACKEDDHCKAKGQKVAILVKTAPSTLPCPSPPPPPKRGNIVVGTSPSFWTVGISWKQPKVVKGNTLVFKWDEKTSANPPHDVWLLPNKKAYDGCDFAKAQKLSGLTKSGEVKYVVKVNTGTLYFGCSYSFHCAAGMKVSVKVSKS